MSKPESQILGPRVNGRIPVLAGLAVLALLFGADPARAQGQVDRSKDRGEGLPLDLFGTYIRAKEFVVYPFFEYYWDSDFEYKPEELGFVGATDYRGRYRASEALVFVGYGLSEHVALEFESALWIGASLEKSKEDTSAQPERLDESGFGDTAARVRWRWNRESDSAPEFYSVFEVGFPFQRSRALTGTQDWEFIFQTGVIRGFSWGTITLHAGIGYSEGVELSEYAFEYLKRLSKRVRVYGAVEGTDDEVELISEAQLFLTENIFVKLNNAFGLTSKAIDWAPEVGVVFSFR